MLQTTSKIIKNKVGLLNLTEELGNVSKTCKIMGFPRDTFYRYKKASEEGLVLTESQVSGLLKKKRLEDTGTVSEIEILPRGIRFSEHLMWVQIKGVSSQMGIL